MHLDFPFFLFLNSLSQTGNVKRIGINLRFRLWLSLGESFNGCLDIAEEIGVMFSVFHDFTIAVDDLSHMFDLFFLGELRHVFNRQRILLVDGFLQILNSIPHCYLGLQLNHSLLEPLLQVHGLLLYLIFGVIVVPLESDNLFPEAEVLFLQADDVSLLLLLFGHFAVLLLQI
jgi:hypothetical protein